MQRRQQEAQQKSKKRQQSVPVSTSKGGAKINKKQSKRLAALAEVVREDYAEDEAQARGEKEVVEPKQEEEGILGKLKGFYKQADDMAAAQALLLNKRLEEEGILEKITDETGLKVVGKDAAAKLQAEKEKETEENPKSLSP